MVIDLLVDRWCEVAGVHAFESSSLSTTQAGGERSSPFATAMNISSIISAVEFHQRVSERLTYLVVAVNSSPGGRNNGPDGREALLALH